MEHYGALSSNGRSKVETCQEGDDLKIKVKWDAHEQTDRMSSMSTLPLRAREAAKAQTSWVLALARGSASPSAVW